jgi:hypothetical protein
MANRGTSLGLGVLIALGGVVLSAGVFAAFFAPGMPHTAWGWAIAAALGLPLLVLAEMVFTLALEIGRPRGARGRTGLSGMVVRLPRVAPGVRLAELAARLLLGAAVFGAILWLLYTVFLDLAAVRAQFR